MTAVRTFNYRQTIGFYAQNGRGFNNPVDIAPGSDPDEPLVLVLSHGATLQITARAADDAPLAGEMPGQSDDFVSGVGSSGLQRALVAESAEVEICIGRRPW